MNWNVIYRATNTHLLDFEFKPDNPNIFYVSGFRLLRFSDTPTNTAQLTPVDLTSALGNGWQANLGTIGEGGHAYRLEIETTPAAPNNLYVVGCGPRPNPPDGEFKNLWVSTNAATAGPIFSAKTAIGATNFTVNRNMLSLAISPLNANEIYLGGVELGKSTDGGNNFTFLNTPHVDHRAVECVAGSNGTARLFSCNDACILFSQDNGTTWTTRCNGLGVSQLYSLAVSNTPNAQSSDKIIIGMQDCTTMIRGQSSWFQPNNVFGDGMVVAIDPNNDNIMYREFQFGGISKTIDGLNFNINVPNSNPPETGEWVTPYVLDPSNSNRLVAGRRNFHIVNFSSTFPEGVHTLKNNPLKPSYEASLITSISVAPSNPNIIIAGYRFGDEGVGNDQITRQLIKLTLNASGTDSWADITPVSFTHKDALVSSIIIHPSDPQKMWITLGGYASRSGHKKVIKSINGGQSWSDYSQGLFGNIPANSIVLNPNRIDDEEVYVSTDLGIYFRNRFMQNWQCFNGALPDTPPGQTHQNQRKNDGSGYLSGKNSLPWKLHRIGLVVF